MLHPRLRGIPDAVGRLRSVLTVRDVVHPAGGLHRLPDRLHERHEWERQQRVPVQLCPAHGAGRGDAVASLRAANPGLDAPKRDRPVLVPLEVLRGDLRIEAVRALFPIDSRTALGWQHWVLDPFGGGEESWEWLGRLFCGSAGAAPELRRANPELPAAGPRRGQAVVIPEARLLRAFRDVAVERPPTPTPSPTAPPPPTATATATSTAAPPPPSTATPAPPVSRVEAAPTAPTDTGPVAPAVEAAAAGLLSYGVDAEGGFAIYRLRQGEALYSAVAVRFTGQLSAAQVNATAADIARRSGITDVTSIPVGHPIRIPLDMLLPEYLPVGDPRRQLAGFERNRVEHVVRPLVDQLAVAVDVHQVQHELAAAVHRDQRVPHAAAVHHRRRAHGAQREARAHALDDLLRRADVRAACRGAALQRAEEDVLVAPHRALGHPGGAAGVEHVEIVARALDAERRKERLDGEAVVRHARHRLAHERRVVERVR